MHFIDHELAEVRKLCHNVIANSKLIACQPSIVRVDLAVSAQLQLSARFRFPAEPDAYPSRQPVLIELRSPTLCDQLLLRLTQLCEQRAKELLGEAQIIEVLRCCHRYLLDNPLCVVFAEVANIRGLLREAGGAEEGEQEEETVRRDGGAISGGGELKLRQKQQQIALVARGGTYEFRLKVLVPQDYPESSVSWTEHSSNLPPVLQRFLNGQAHEIARQCVEPPLRPAANAGGAFRPRPSLQPTFAFLIAATADFRRELCPVCEQPALPALAADAQLDDTADAYVERVLCGHLYHQGCLKRYMREPPFPVGGKCCPAKRKHPRADRRPAAAGSGAIGGGGGGQSMARGGGRRRSGGGGAAVAAEPQQCAERLSHDRWGLSVRLAEARWAQQQARVRELEEVVDFMQ